VLEEDGADGLLPGEVDELLVGLDGVGDGGCGREDEGQKGDRSGDRSTEGGAAWVRNWVCPLCSVSRAELRVYFTERRCG
jgi:hypothetical protein